MNSGARPDRAVFFLDRNLGSKIVAGELRRAGHRVEIHDDHFAPAVLDVDWLREVGSRGWVVLTKDRRIVGSGIDDTSSTR